MTAPSGPESPWRLNPAEHLDAVRDLVTAVAGPVARLEPLPVWGPTVVVAVRLDDGTEVVLKASARQDVAAEAAACRLAADIGVLAPGVLAQGVDDRLPGGDWYLMERLAGVAWKQLPTDADRDAIVLDDLAEQFARLHRPRLPGFGPLDDGRGRAASWSRWLHDGFTANLDRLDTAPCGLGETARAVVTDLEPVLARRPGVLVHGDLGDGEVFVDPATGRVTGLADWGSALVGDGWYDLARFVAGGPVGDPRVPRLVPGLRERYARLTGIGIDRRLLDLYEALNAVDNAVWAQREGVDWVPALVTEAERLLRGLTAR